MIVIITLKSKFPFFLAMLQQVNINIYVKNLWIAILTGLTQTDGTDSSMREACMVEHLS